MVSAAHRSNELNAMLMHDPKYTHKQTHTLTDLYMALWRFGRRGIKRHRKQMPRSDVHHFVGLQTAPENSLTHTHKPKHREDTASIRAKMPATLRMRVRVCACFFLYARRFCVLLFVCEWGLK